MWESFGAGALCCPCCAACCDAACTSRTVLVPVRLHSVPCPLSCGVCVGGGDGGGRAGWWGGVYRGVCVGRQTCRFCWSCIGSTHIQRIAHTMPARSHARACKIANTRKHTHSLAHARMDTHGHTWADLSILLFLKFISSIIPTIEYDFTVNFDTGAARR